MTIERERREERGDRREERGERERERETISFIQSFVFLKKKISCFPFRETPVEKARQASQDSWVHG